MVLLNQLRNQLLISFFFVALLSGVGLDPEIAALRKQLSDVFDSSFSK